MAGGSAEVDAEYQREFLEKALAFYRQMATELGGDL